MTNLFDSYKIKAEGVDLIDCSSGFNTPDYKNYPFGPNWQVPFAEKIRTQAQIATAAVGSITEATQAEQIIQNQQADIVLLATQMLRDPYWPYHAALKLQPKDTAKALLPVQYGGRVKTRLLAIQALLPTIFSLEIPSEKVSCIKGC